MRIYYRLLVWASALGLITSTSWHVLTLFGIPVSRSLWMPFFLAMFGIWFTAIISIMPLKDRIAADRSRFWKTVLEGAPTWMCLAVLYIGIYVVVNWVLTTGGLSRVTDRDPSFPRVGSAVMMLFYSSAMAMLYAAGARDRATHCPEGHWVFEGQAVCSVCGQSAVQQTLSAARHGA